MNSDNPEIPGLGSPIDEETLAPGWIIRPAPGASVWTDLYETIMPPGKTIRLLSGTSSQKYIGTADTGRLRLQVWGEAPAPIPPTPIPPDPIPVPPIPPTPIPPIPPGPLPPVVRTLDRTGANQQQIQYAIDNAQPGDGIYLGPGYYSFPGPSRSADGQMIDVLNKDGITIFGAGPTTVLDMGGREGIWFRQGGRIGIGNVIRDLSIRNCRRAVVALDRQRLFVLRLEITNALYGYATERTSAYDNAMYEWPVTLEDISVRDWSGHGMKLMGGETVRRCQLVDTPGNSGSTYSHGMYITGARNVLIEDVLIENVAGHAFQIYSDSATHASNGAENITMRRVTCRNGRYGPVIAANGTYTNLLLEDLTVTGTVSRETGTLLVSATNDWINGLTMKNVVLDGGGDGLVLQGPLTGSIGGIKGMMVDGLRVTNHNVGVVIAPPGWASTRIENSIIRGYQCPGVPMPVRGTSSGLVIA